MLVPAIAFSWWLASVPMGKAPVAKPPSIATAAARIFAATPDDAIPTSADEGTAPAEETPEVTDETGQRTLYRGLITPAIAQQAREFLDLPMGSERMADVEGHHFVFVLERHYHPPGFVGAPTGWHKGVTVYSL